MKKLISCAMDIGELMLKSGAEVHRVEDSMTRICHALGAQRVDIFIITSSMVLTVHTADGNVHTQTRRIKSLGTDFHKLDQLNQLSRRICSEQLSLEEIQSEIDSIKSGKKYPFWLECLIYAIIAGAFTILFGGDLAQCILSMIIGVILRFAVLLADNTVKNMIFSKFISGFTITALAFLAFKLGLIVKTDEVIIGDIMLLIPGLGFTNAFRDLFTGDSIAGMLRILEAVLCAAAIAAGYFLLVFLTGGVSI